MSAAEDKDSVEVDSQVRAAFLNELLLMGEAVKRLSPEFCAGRSDVLWSQTFSGVRPLWSQTWFYLWSQTWF